MSRTLAEDLENLGHELRQFKRELKNSICQSISRHMPRRLLYFSVIKAIAIMTSDPRNRNLEIPSLAAMDVATYIEPK